MTEQEKARGRFFVIAVLLVVPLFLGSMRICAYLTMNQPAETRCFNEYHCKVVLGSWLKPVEYEWYETADSRLIEHVYMFEGRYRIENNAMEEYTSAGREPISDLPADAFRWLIIGREALKEYREKTNATQAGVAF